MTVGELIRQLQQESVGDNDARVSCDGFDVLVTRKDASRVAIPVGKEK